MINNVTKIETRKEKTRKRVAAYCRVSTDTESQLDSLENQMEAFRYQLTLHDDWELVDIYADEGLSGTSVKGRAKFQEMIEACEKGQIDYIITKSISRFARNTLDCIGYVRKLQSFGTQVYFEKEGIDTGDATSEMLLTIMASFAQEESRSISENVKWGIRKRFEEGKEVKVQLYGFRHTEIELFLIVPEEAAVVREIFERYVHGETAMEILRDMEARGVKPPAGDSWKMCQFNRMLNNEKYCGDVVLQKTYIENHLNHRQIRNKGEVPKFRVTDAHPAIVDKHLFQQAQKILTLRRVQKGNCSYPYGELLICPHCGKPLVHGSLNNFYYDGGHIQNGGWGCYGDGGCGEYLVIQNNLDEAVIRAYDKKYGERKDQVDFYWLDDTVERIEPREDDVTIYWKDGTRTTEPMHFSKRKYKPTAYADFYNDYLECVRSGEKKTKNKYLMGLDMSLESSEEERHEDNENSGEAE